MPPPSDTTPIAFAAGGNDTVFRRRRFEFDIGIHYLGDCQPGGIIPRILIDCEGYQAVKIAVMQRMIAAAEHVIPGLRDHVVFQEAATLLTHTR